MAETRIGVVGCGGRMGRFLLAEIHATKGCAIAGGIDAEQREYQCISTRTSSWEAQLWVSWSD